MTLKRSLVFRIFGSCNVENGRRFADIESFCLKTGHFFRWHVDVHKGRGVRLMWTGGGGRKPDFRVDIINE